MKIKPDIQSFPRVTKIIQALGLSDFSKCPPTVLETACQYGKHVHKMLEFEDKGILDLRFVDKAIENDLLGWQKFKADYNVEVLAIEQPVHSLKYSYKGTLDRVVKINKGQYDGTVAVVDVKTKTSIDKACHLQVDGYKVAWNESRPKDKPRATKKLIVQLTQDGNYKLFDSNQPHNNNIFISAMNFYHWFNIKGE